MGCGGSHQGALETARITPATAAGAPRNGLKDTKDLVGLPGHVQATLPTVTLDGSLLPESVRAAALRDLSRRPGVQSAHTRNHHPSLGDETTEEDQDIFTLLDEEYGHVITEASTPDLVRQVEEEFASRARLLFVVELIVEGKGVPRLMSPKEKERAEQDQILETLRREGLVPKPPAIVNNGIKFEIVSSSPPFQQMNFPSNRPVTAKKVLSLQEIEEKLEKAQERRKQQEDERRRAASKSPGSEAVTQQQQQQQQEIQARIEARHKAKMEARTKSRETHLKDLQRKLREHQVHVEQVRQRKLTIVPSLSQED